MEERERKENRLKQGEKKTKNERRGKGRCRGNGSQRQGIDQAKMEWKRKSENETKKRGNETCQEKKRGKG